ncbi:MAG: IS630 transposase-related protein [Phycisphaerae bacterium]|nr:IS630 transposase-related protein [Phycisphaerae bacterium]
MGAAYSQDLRGWVLAAFDRGMKTKLIAKLFQVSPAWARRVKQRRRETGETTPRPMGGPTIFKIDLARLEEHVHQQPAATGPELRVRLGVQCSDAAIYMALARLGLTFKKRRSARRSRPGSTSPSEEKAGGRSRRRSTSSD